MTEYNTSGPLLTKKFEMAREKLFSWQDFDDGHEFSVKDLVMIDNRNNSGVACIIEYTGPDRPEGRVGFIAASKRYATMFVGVHIIVDKIPIDGDWSSVHGANYADYMELLRFIYKSPTPHDTMAQEMMAVRRQMLLYRLVFSDTGELFPEVTDEERLLLADATIMGSRGKYIDALREFISKTNLDRHNKPANHSG